MATLPARDVPGTVLLVDQSNNKHGDIVLVPQPSEDPEDPLNWTRKRKLWSLFMVFVYTMGVGIPGTLHYSVIADISKDTGIPTVDLGASAASLCWSGASADGLQSMGMGLCFCTVRLGLSAPPAHRSRLRKTRRLPPVDSPHRPDHDLDSKLIFIG
jgi:hypothetical protein